jgi:hypothetical protein
MGAQSSTGARIHPHADAPIADADLSLAPFDTSLPLGELLLDAAGALVFAQFGASDLSGALQAVVPCHALGQSVSDGLGDFLSASDLTLLCDGALAGIATLAEQKLKALRLDGIAVHDTKASLFDVAPQAPAIDFQSDQLQNGSWTWTFTVDGSAIDVPSTLAGPRIASAF